MIWYLIVIWHMMHCPDSFVIILWKILVHKFCEKQHLELRLKLFEKSFIHNSLSKSKKTSYFWGVQQVDSSRARRLKSLPIVSVQLLSMRVTLQRERHLQVKANRFTWNEFPCDWIKNNHLSTNCGTCIMLQHYSRILYIFKIIVIMCRQFKGSL